MRLYLSSRLFPPVNAKGATPCNILGLFESNVQRFPIADFIALAISNSASFDFIYGLIDISDHGSFFNLKFI